MKNRTKTEDIDYFGDENTIRAVSTYHDNVSLNPDVSKVLQISGAKYDAEKLNETPQHWPPNWINCEMIAHILNLEGCENLYQTSIAEGIKMFESKSLEVYAADWKYQLVGKIVRAHDNKVVYDTERRYFNESRDGKDLADAVAILRLMVKKNGRPLRLTDLRTWYYYGPGLKDDAIAYVNAEYQKKYDALGII